jgi:pilus assembly protein CpaB
VASIGITEVMARRNAEPAGMIGDTQPIFVAMTDIGLGDTLSSQVLKLEQWPKDKVPAGAISKIEDIEGRRTRTKLYMGEPTLQNRQVGKGGSEQGATALIPKGYRVVPVKVDLVSGGSSMIVPGDRVDVMVHLVHDAARGIQETVTRTILQDIKVFAVDDVVDLEKEKDGTKRIAAKTISLLVTPAQAAKVVLATQMGNINLVMRSPEDDQQVGNSEAKPSELFGGPAKAEREKETLMLPEPKQVAKKTQGFLDFLSSMKNKTAQVAAHEAKPRETWTMRVLKPGDVAEVQFEADADSENSPVGAWRTTTGSSGTGNSRPAAHDSKPPATPTPDPNIPPAQPTPSDGSASSN